MPTNHDDDQDSEIAFSRNGLGTPVGKLEDRFTSYADIETGLAFRRMCSEARQTPSERLRDCAYLDVHGMTYSDYCAHELKRKRQAVFGTGVIEELKPEDQSGGAA